MVTLHRELQGRASQPAEGALVLGSKEVDGQGQNWQVCCRSVNILDILGSQHSRSAALHFNVRNVVSDTVWSSGFCWPQETQLPNTQSRAQKRSLTGQGTELPRTPAELEKQSYPGHVQVVVKLNPFLGLHWKSNLKSVWVVWGLSKVCVSLCFL